MKRNKPHLTQAHALWKEFLHPGDIVIDATCGNGHDTLLLAKLILTPYSGTLIACDIQPKAIQQTQQLLKASLDPQCYQKVSWHEGSHATFPETIAQRSVKLIVYNLGYLPGGDKGLTTQSETTIQSVKSALQLLQAGGTISITCYPGHSEGEREESALLEFITHLDPQQWECSHTRWLNRKHSPSLVIVHNLAPRN